MNYAFRIGLLRSMISQLSLDGVLITNLRNVRFLSGFTGSAATLLITQDKAQLFTDGRYTLQATQEAVDYQVLVPQQFSDDPLAAQINGHVHKLGFEGACVTVLTYDRWKKRFNPSLQLVPCEEIIEPMRLVKDEGELQTIAHACQIADDTFQAILPKIHAGLSEIELCIQIEFMMRQMGASRPSFDTIIASGERSAMPHAEPSGRLLQSGDMITMDFGAECRGYCSDITRTVALGPVSDELRHIYDVVLKAQMAALDVIKPGMTGKEVDAVARQVITEAGYGDKFKHGLGHSLGLEVHDGKGLSTLSELVLRPGMVMTVEPGIYIDGIGGVRIEDDVVITESGCECLTYSPKEFMQLSV